MPDRISNLPDSILCYVLSFLPTKEVVATSVLSKRWNLLWRSVTSLDFDLPGGDEYGNEVAYSRFLLSVYSFLFTRNMEQPLHKLLLGKTVRVSGRLQHLDLSLFPVIAVPSVVFSCKTLVVLKLTYLALKNISFVDFPLLKILHLICVSFSKDSDLLQQFLSGSPNLEDLKVKNFSANAAKKFNRFSKLVRAEVDAHLVPLQNVKNVEVLVLDGIMRFEIFPLAKGLEAAVLAYTQPVPTCISLHLKTCFIKQYSGFVVQFLFAKYIMQNANYLRTLKFCFNCSSEAYKNPLLRDAMIRDLSSCRKRSYICTLSFE
ncbi:hypothetical protein PHAVU_004G016400 [Phaseolus vulgaris]